VNTTAEPGYVLLKREAVRGSCGICSEESGALSLARYWDCDDGWRVGPICSPCLSFCRPPAPDDYAYGADSIAEDDYDGDIY